MQSETRTMPPKRTRASCDQQSRKVRKQCAADLGRNRRVSDANSMDSEATLSDEGESGSEGNQSCRDSQSENSDDNSGIEGNQGCRDRSADSDDNSQSENSDDDSGSENSDDGSGSGSGSDEETAKKSTTTAGKRRPPTPLSKRKLCSTSRSEKPEQSKRNVVDTVAVKGPMTRHRTKTAAQR